LGPPGSARRRGAAGAEPAYPATVQPCTRRGGSYPYGVHPQTARVQDDDVIWEFPDQGLAALNLNALRRDDDADQN
jgi:hypothetical protein